MMKPHTPKPTTRTVQPAPPRVMLADAVILLPKLEQVCQQFVDACHAELTSAQYAAPGPLRDAMDAAAELGITPTEQP